MNSRGKPRTIRPPGNKSPGRGDNGGRNAARKDTPNTAALDETPERIAKILARAGVASRRAAERMISEGRIRLNGKVLDTPAVTAKLSDTIEVDGEPLRGIDRTRLWLYYKPTGLVTTHHDPQGRKTVFETLKLDQPHVVSVGRLDINTEGLLLITNDGGLARELELPSTGWLRRYRVRAHGSVDQSALDGLREGLAVDGVLYGSIEATLDRVQGSNVWITMGLREGKNREVKNVMAALGLEVNRLIRISYGPFQLGALEEGAIVEVKSRTLREQLGPRLIERAGANFEAPLFNAKSAGEKKKQAPRQADKRRSQDDRGSFAEGSRKEYRGKSPDRKDTASRGDERPKPQQRTNRTANVWMAPGARPVGKNKKTSNAGTNPLKSGSRGSRPEGSAGSRRDKRHKPVRGADRGSHADRRR